MATTQAATQEGNALPKVPYKEQDVQEVATMVRGLEDAAKKGKKSNFMIKKSRYTVEDSVDGILVDSWKMSDFDYKKRGLPTYARGLFTKRDRDGKPEIAIRGYDKFFNINEMENTRWEVIEEKTRGPYELTLKENGCIIFISGLEDDTLLVCSKHSTGSRGNAELSHSSAGAAHVEAQLKRIGKTKEDLARELRARNVTAVAELCDDAFEEHILAYGPDKAGLYLHGINLNLPEFATYPSVLVQSFADQWAFKKVDLITMDDIKEVRTFLEGVGETGAYDGRDVEGFVIRCQMSPNKETRPYEDWFFKYKFEEPYLMYRQWRECTKALISGKPPRYKKHKTITEEYLLFARKRIAADPSLGTLYTQNHGIIQLRDEFLHFKNLNGSDAANFEELYGGDNGISQVSKDVILVPIATIGCGKTTVGLALGKLFGYGHVQNDNITGTKRPPRFTRMLLDQLETQPAVYADRNNAMRHERKQLIHDVRTQHVAARLVAINFVHNNIDAIRQLTHERVFARGDNHQTIHAATEKGKVVGIMEGFINRFEPCDPEHLPDSGFDAIINVDPTDSSRVNVEKVVRELHELYPKLIPEVPSAEAMDAAVEAAIGDYNPELRHTLPDRGRNNRQKLSQVSQNQPAAPKFAKKKPLEYMSVDVSSKDINNRLEQAFKSLKPSQSKFYLQLKQTRRVQPAFHVTLMHRASAKQHPKLWERYVQLQKDAEAAAEAAGPAGSPEANKALELGQIEVQLERVVFDNRLMAMIVRLVDKNQPAEGSGNSDETDGWKCVNKVSHITIGTRDSSVKPKESNDLLERWLSEGSTEQNQILDVGIEGRPLIEGVIRGVLSH